ncbi:MAG: GFA family protein [Rhizomicrobium sp.]
MRTLHTTDKIRFYFAANEGAKNQMQLSAKCQCGKVEFKASGPPILTTACYCTDCQTAGRQFEQLPSAPPMLDPDSGTGMILYRKDRVQCAKGQEFLEERRLKPTSPTRRVVATCCNSAMFLDFTKGHWLSMFRNRFGAGAPPLEMRVMTKERRAGVALADDVPNYPGRSGKFMRKLLTSWAAMGFRRPEIPWGKAIRRAQ